MKKYLVKDFTSARFIAQFINKAQNVLFCGE